MFGCGAETPPAIRRSGFCGGRAIESQTFEQRLRFDDLRHFGLPREAEKLRKSLPQTGARPVNPLERRMIFGSGKQAGPADFLVADAVPQNRSPPIALA